MIDQTDGSPALARAIRVVERIAGAVLGLVTVLIVISAIGRYGFASPVPDAFDVSRLVLGVAIAWGLASLGFHGTHIKVDILAHGVSRGLRRWINAFAWAVLLAFTGLLTWKIGQRVLDALGSGDATMELRLAHWPFFAGIWLGIAAAFFTTCMRLWLIVGQGRELADYDGIDDQLAEDIRRNE